MNLNNIKIKLSNYDHNIIDKDKKLISAVLIPLVTINNQTHLLFQRRSRKIKTQPGEVSFPGGKYEQSDKTLKDTAIRESCEELGLNPTDIDIITEMDTLITPFNIIIYNYLGVIKNINDIAINEDEVDYIFTVPLQYFLDNTPLEVIGEISLKYGEDFPIEKTPNGSNANKYTPKNRALFYEYGENVIWGFTALIIENLVKVLKSL
ncbi:MAG: NUDIX hydrolase [Filifactoraceae bacterium]